MGDMGLRFIACRKTEVDARRIMDWRNDPEVRGTAFHPEVKEWRAFWPEYQAAYFPDAGCPGPAFIEIDGTLAGYLRFRPLTPAAGLPSPACDISIVLDATHRGRGLGAEVLVAAQAYLRDHRIAAVVAEVISTNIASARVFAKAGFQRLGRSVKRVADTGETFEIDTFVARLDGAAS